MPYTPVSVVGTVTLDGQPVTTTITLTPPSDIRDSSNATLSPITVNVISGVVSGTAMALDDAGTVTHFPRQYTVTCADPVVQKALPAYLTVRRSFTSVDISAKATRSPSSVEVPAAIAPREVLSGGRYYNVSTSFNLVTSANTAVDDLLVVITMEDWNLVDNMPSPAGTSSAWTSAVKDSLGADLPHLRVWHRKVTSAGAQTVTIRQNTVDPGEYAAILYVFPAGTVIEDVQITKSASNSASFVAPSVESLGGNRLLVTGYASGWTPDGAISLAPATGSGMTEAAEVSVTSGSTAAALALMSATQTVQAGDTGTRTATVTGTSKPYLACSILLRTETEAERLIRDVVTDELSAVPSLEELAQSRFIGAVSGTGTHLLGVAMTDQRIGAFSLAATGAISANDTNYWSVALVRYRAGSATTIATRTTQTAAPNGAVTANVSWSFDLIAFGSGQYLNAGDVLAVTFTATGSPTAWAGALGSWRYEPGVTP